MYFKRYSFAVLIFTVIVSWYIYAFITSSSLAPTLYTLKLPLLPVAAWIAILIGIVYLFSILHFSSASLISSFRLRKFSKDHDKLLIALSNAYLQNSTPQNYQTDRYKLLGTLVQNSSMYFNGEVSDIDHGGLNQILQIIHNIKNGEVVELKKYNLDPTNPFVIANNLNRYKAHQLSPEDILKKQDAYDHALVITAYNDLVKTASFDTILKHKEIMNKDALFIILDRLNLEENGLELSNDQLKELINLVDADEQTYIEMSKLLSTKLSPESRIKLFETLSETHEKAMNAYLFTLFDLEMLSAADEILNNTQPDEYVSFKAYSSLKKCNQNYDISLFV